MRNTAQWKPVIRYRDLDGSFNEDRSKIEPSVPHVCIPLDPTSQDLLATQLGKLRGGKTWPLSANELAAFVFDAFQKISKEGA